VDGCALGIEVQGGQTKTKLGDSGLLRGQDNAYPETDLGEWTRIVVAEGGQGFHLVLGSFPLFAYDCPL
jgi:hypothetical protein